ncbi:EF-P beta-lysylation protein EpmB [Methylophaga sp. OBS1]|uniref:EF-P beta-lysylation protein EpmB n=1 Tax=Methylophaga sp. OBS1 TaxID=2991933 RepID=UPI002251C056|nr:EF-P beta-lysylation protein EpmB [Methylophaga sp. OBS1]MCX4192849.1 EF-P beta-lysylation protein EpmB [Methylophaga sp. OBS1]
MIPQSPPLKTKQSWQQALAEAVSDADELLAQLGLSGALKTIDKAKIRQFPLRVPQSYINKMRYGDKQDPLLKQVLPLIDESLEIAGFGRDPVGDQLAVTGPGILQKYQGRALLVTTGACAIHCRYCFRRHFPYSDSNPLASQFNETLAQLQADTHINEVILSGGDPLSLSDDKLSRLVAELEQIPHLKRLRIHTRLPVVLPERIDANLLKWISDCELKVVMVIHANHANEIDEDAELALLKLQQAGCQLLNQTVLLRGINDSVDALVNLSERLNDVNVMPYYLHLLDKVAGAAHFDVTEASAIGLLDKIRTQLPGYLVPRLVREIQGEASKTIIR